MRQSIDDIDVHFPFAKLLQSALKDISVAFADWPPLPDAAEHIRRRGNIEPFVYRTTPVYSASRRYCRCAVSFLELQRRVTPMLTDYIRLHDGCRLSSLLPT